MTGYLLYSAAEAVRNEWFIGELIRESHDRGLCLELLIEEELEIAESAVTCKGDPLPLPDLVIARVQNYALSKSFEELGVRVFNSSRVSLICNDKARTLALAESLCIPTMKSWHLTPNELPDLSVYPYPCVIKPVDGKGGKDVILCRDRGELAAVYDKTFKGRHALIQALASDIGRDSRVYVMGSRVLSAFTRVSDSDFRSNFCLGGRAIPHTVTPEESEMIEKFCKALSPDFVGIDFIYHNGQPVFNEIEDVVGSRMVYTHTDINVAGEYIEYIINEIKK